MAFSLAGLHPLTKLLLKNRGVKDEEIEDFLFPSYEKHIGNPFDIYGMEKAVTRIVEAIRDGEKIAIYSDYDCDGIPGGVLLREFFDAVAYPVEMYIPHRHNEGYGIHNHALDVLKDKGMTLVITVDSGIANIEEVAYAKKIGLDVIVTDHHLPIHEDLPAQAGGRGGQIVPAAIAVVNSKQDACTYDDDMLCGCAVAWKLACALLSRLREGDVRKEVDEAVKNLPDGYEKWLLDLVGISTIADMVPLRKENRALAHFGLKVLRKTKRPGLLHIFNQQRVRKDFLTEDDIAFTIAPRINASSRMGDPIQGHKMLYEKDIRLAEQYAEELEALNTQRKNEVKDIVSGISFDQDVYKNDVIVVGDTSWVPGILGLIAQKIIDEIGKPVFVWGQGDDTEVLKGSCRSRGDVHIVDLMAHVGHDVFTGWGGHEEAGGFSLSKEKIGLLSPALNEAITKLERKVVSHEDAQADSKLSLNDVTDDTYKAIEILAPFGEGNPKPIFSFENVSPESIRRFGKKDEHLEIIYKKDSGTVKAISFFASKDLESRAQQPHTLLAHIEKSYFSVRGEMRLRVKDIETPSLL